MSKLRYRYWILFTMTVLVCACVVETSPYSTYTSIPPTTSRNTPSLLETISVTETATRICSSPSIEELELMPEPIHEFLLNIMSYLYDSLDVTLLTATEAYSESDIQMLSADLNGDSLDELVVAAVFPLEDPIAPGGYIGAFIFSPCVDGEYELIPISGSEFEYNCQADFCLYHLIVTDIAGLGFPQILLAFEERYFNWSYPLITVTGWRDGNWDEFMHEELDIGPLVSLTVYDSDHDGLPEISVWGYRLGTMMFEIGRAVMLRYEWQTDRVILKETEPMPSPYRFQILEDAQRALDIGDIQYAIALYLSAADGFYINEPSLGTKGLYQETEYDLSLDEVAGEYQTSFARFRLIYLYEFIEQHDDVDYQLRVMQGYYPSGEPGSEFAELTATFVEKSRQGITLSDACRASVEFIVDKYPDITGFNGHIGSWGYTSIDYTEDNLCPDL